MIALPSTPLPAGTLLHHVSRTQYRARPLHYGRDATNRYDAPDRDYGVLYLARDLPTALMESVFHKHRWTHEPARAIALAEVRGRMVRAVGVLEELLLADVTAPSVMAGHFGLNLEQLACRDYVYTQRVSASVHALHHDDGKPCFDGILYPSRNNYPAACIALFERAGRKVKVFKDLDLVEHVDWPAFVDAYEVAVMPDPEPLDDPD